MTRISKTPFLSSVSRFASLPPLTSLVAGVAIVASVAQAQAGDIDSVLSSVAAGSYSAGYLDIRTEYQALAGSTQTQAGDQLSPAIYDALFDSVFSNQERLHDVMGRTSGPGTGARFLEGAPSAAASEWEEEDLAALEMWGQDKDFLGSWSASTNPVFQLVGFDIQPNPATQVGVTTGICQDAFGSYPCARGIVQGTQPAPAAQVPAQAGGGMIPNFSGAVAPGYANTYGAPYYPAPTPGFFPGFAAPAMPGMVMPGMMLPGMMLPGMGQVGPSFPTNPALAPMLPTTGVAGLGMTSPQAVPGQPTPQQPQQQASQAVPQPAQQQAAAGQPATTTDAATNTPTPAGQDNQDQGGGNQASQAAPLAPIQQQGQFQPLPQPELPPASQQPRAQQPAAQQPAAQQAQMRQPRPSLMQRLLKRRRADTRQTGLARQPFPGQDADTSVFVAPFYLARQSDDTGNNVGHDENGFGVLVGADHSWSPEMSSGIGASYVTTNLDSTYLNAEASLQGYGLTGYTHYEGDELFFDAKVSGNFTAADVKRTVSLPGGFSDIAKSSPNMLSMTASAKTGLSILDMMGGERCLSCMAQDTDVRPYFGLTFQGARMDSLTEAAAGGSSLQVEAESGWAVDYALGVAVDTNVSLGPVMVVPNLDLSYHYDWQSDRSLDAAVTDQPNTSFSYTGRALDGSSLGFGVGLDVISAGVVDGYIRYDGQYRIGGIQNATHVTSFGMRLNF